MNLACRVLSVVSGVTLVLFVTGADDGTQTIDAKGLTFRVPEKWKSTPPSSSMRRAQLTIAAASGDTEPAELVVTAFPNRAGTVDQNIARWQNQFKTDEGKAPEIKREKVKGKNVDVTRAEVSGTYTDPFARGGPKPKTGYRLLGAIVESKSGGQYFLKLVGPEKTVTAIKPEFDQMLGTIEDQSGK
jgi:hypothetical protein